MGVYSNLAIQKINEQEMLENFQFSDLLEFAINIQKSDQAMFDAMLEMDFHEAYEEKGIISLTEGEKIDAVKAAAKGIWNKIIEALTKFLTMVKTFLAKISNVFSDLSGKNKALIKAIKELKGREDELLKAAEGKDTKVTIVVNNKEFIKKMHSAINKVNDAARNASLKGEVDNTKSDVESATKDLYDGFEKHFEKVSLKDSISKVDLGELYTSVDKPEIDSYLETCIKELISYISSQIDLYKKKKKEDEVSPEDRAKYSKTISVLNISMSGASKIFSVIKSYYARKAAAERALYTKYGVLLGIKLGVGDNAKLARDFNVNAGKAIGSATAKAAKDAAGKVAKTAKDASDAIKSKFAKKETTTEAAEELNYQFMTIDVVNETYIDQLFA
jgi:hypothetical protein